MKTLRELYNEVIASDDEKRSFVQALRQHAVEDFMSERGCDATKSELMEFLETEAEAVNAMAKEMGEVKEADLGSLLTSGCGGYPTVSDTCFMVCC